MKQKTSIERICVINPYIAALGGGEKHMGYFIQFLEERYEHARIDLIVFNYDDVDVHADGFTTIEDINRKFNLKLKHTNIVKIDTDPSGTKAARIRNKRLIEHVTKGYDLLINNMFLSKHSGQAKYNIYLCMFPPKPYATEHKAGVPDFAARYLDRRFYQSYDAFICNSQYTKQWLGTYWNEPAGEQNGKQTVIYPPVFTEQEAEGRYNEREKKNIILSVGRFFASGHCKQQLEMVKFFLGHKELFRDYEYHLAGSVTDNPDDLEYFRQVRNLASTADNVIIHQNCSYTELTELYRQAKIFWHATGYRVDEKLYPEKMEHFGITTAEAMSFGVVPVVINKGGQKEIILNGETGYLWDHEEECIAYTSALIQNEQKRKASAKRAAERAKLFSAEEFYQQNAKLFNERGL